MPPLERFGILLFRPLTILDHVSFNSRLREWSLVEILIVFFDVKLNNEFLHIHLILLVLQVVIEVLLVKWQLPNDGSHLECFTQYYNFKVNLMQDHLKLLDLTNHFLEVDRLI